MKESNGSTTRDQYTVVLEDLRSQFQAFGEGLFGLNEKMDKGFREVNLRLDRHEEILNSHTIELSSHTEKLDSHTEMIGQLMVDVTELKSDVSVLKTDMVEVKKDIKELKTDMKEVKVDLKRKVDKSEVSELKNKILVLENNK